MFPLVRKIWRWIKSWFKKPKQESPSVEKEHFVMPVGRQKMAVSFVIDVPENTSPQTIYIVGENSFYWMAGFICPCGCGDFIHLNLLKKANPRWNFKIVNGLISVSPSIWRTYGCKSHFFISKGEVIWAKKSTLLESHSIIISPFSIF